MNRSEITVEDRPQPRAVVFAWSGPSHPVRMGIQEEDGVRYYPLTVHDLLRIASEAAHYAAIKVHYEGGK